MNNRHQIASNQPLDEHSRVNHPPFGKHTNSKNTSLTGFSGLAPGSFAPLGSNAKSSDTFELNKPVNKGLDSHSQNTLLELIDEDTGEIRTVKRFEWGDVEHQSPEQILTEKFSMQGAVRKLMPGSRTAKCTRLTTGGEVSVQKSIEHKTCSYKGLQTCGSVWACPVCSARVSVKRRNETIEAMEKHKSAGGHLYFLTLTFPHSNAESLKELKEKFSKALKIFRSSYDYKTYKKDVGYVGLIRALEVTFGFSNGWHPHSHEVIFAKNEMHFSRIKSKLFQPWKKACIKAGLPAPSFRRGLDVKGGDKAGEYINKFGNELAMSHVKKARSERFSPFDLLRGYLHENDKQLGAKFVEYAEAMKGARQLFWTKGLKSMFAIDEKTDDELACTSDDKNEELGRIHLDKWRAVIRYNARATVLLLSQNHSFSKAEKVIDALYLSYVSSGDKQKDDIKKANWLENERLKACQPKAKTAQETNAIFEGVKAQMLALDNTKKEDAKRRKAIRDYTEQWYVENMSNISNPYAG